MMRYAGITPPPFGLNATPPFGLDTTPAAGVETTGKDPTPDQIVTILDAALNLSLDDSDDMEGLIQIDKALPRPYEAHTVKLVKRLAKNKDQSIE